MSSFHLLGGEMHAEAVPLASIAAAVGTPAYVYSAGALRHAAQRFRAALGKVPRKQLMFAVKANPSPAVLRVLADQNFGADIVSGGELDCALSAGITANHIVYSGVAPACPAPMSKPMARWSPRSRATGTRHCCSSPGASSRPRRASS